MPAPNAPEESGSPILVLWCDKLKWVAASIVHSKGVDPFAVEWLAASLEELGLRRFVLRSDGEPPIMALKREAKKLYIQRSGAAEHEVLLETSAKAESQSNGAV